MAKHTRRKRRAGVVLTGASVAVVIGASPAVADGEWDVIAECESSNQNVENGVSTASGYFQIIDGTWAGAGGLEFAPRAIEATYDEQLIVAKRIAAARGSLADWNASKSCWGGRISDAVPADTPEPKPEAPKPAPAPEPAPPAPAPVASVGVDGYTVVRGDTVASIAGRAGMDWKKLAKINKLSAPYTIYPGDVLKTRVAPAKYTVQQGDFLSKIAPQFNMTTQELYQSNLDVIGDNPNLIYPGQVLAVKGSVQVAATVEETQEAPVASRSDRPAEVKSVSHPVPGGALTSGYGARWGSFHDGVDFDCAIGDAVYAAMAGEVETSEFNDGGYGNWVRIRHADGSLTFYAHLDSRVVGVGESVVAGQQIATCGNTGHVVSSTGDGSHLHFGAEVGPGSINPFDWASQRGLTL